MKTLPTLLLAAVFALCCLTAHAGLEVPTVIGDHMVLQRDKPVPIWGKANPGDSITVTFADQSHETTAAADGTWKVSLDPMPVSAQPRPLTIRAQSENRTITLNDILVGEVWLCSGQSNMQWSVRQSKDPDIEIRAARYPNLRLYQVNRQVSQTPRFSAAGAWAACTPESVADFSAVGYYFGRDLHQVMQIPVGLIDSSWGGTPAEAWTRTEALAGNEATRSILEDWEERINNYPAVRAKWQDEVKAFDAQHGKPQPINLDKHIAPKAAGFAKAGFDDSKWARADLPGAWDMSFDGAKWYRRTVSLPEAMQNSRLQLELGPIDDFDQTFVNGERVGFHDASTPNAWQLSRRYDVPAALTRGGELTIAVRVVDTGGLGGFMGEKDDMRLVSLDTEGDPLPLNGSWGTVVEQKLNLARATGRRPRQPQGPNSAGRPANLAYGMLGPVVPYAIKGAVWYQGESNAGRAEQYRSLLPLMIKDWRARWGQGDFPFGVVQLANFMKPEEAPTDPQWAHLRDAQRHAAVSDPNTGLAVITDVGEANDIHPRNKQEVGRRLARWALADVYGQKEVAGGGPVYLDYTTEGNKIIVRFNSRARSLKVFNEWKLHGFIIAGEDKTWHRAEAAIQGNDRVAVWSDKVPQPVAVRYAWANNPHKANLVNDQLLPAGPFRTDDW